MSNSLCRETDPFPDTCQKGIYKCHDGLPEYVIDTFQSLMKQFETKDPVKVDEEGNIIVSKDFEKLLRELATMLHSQPNPPFNYGISK